MAWAKAYVIKYDNLDDNLPVFMMNLVMNSWTSNRGFACDVIISFYVIVTMSTV